MGKSSWIGKALLFGVLGLLLGMAIILVVAWNQAKRNNGRILINALYDPDADRPATGSTSGATTNYR